MSKNTSFLPAPSLTMASRHLPPTTFAGRLFAEKRARFRAGVARGGVEYVVTAAASHLPDRLLRYEHHVLLACEKGLRLPREGERAVTSFAGAGDVRRLSRHGNLDAAAVRRRIGRGDACVLVSEGSRVVASAWAATGTRHLIGMGRGFAIPRDAFYVYDTFTEPDVRRRGLATACYRGLFDEFAARGRPTAYAAVGVLNAPSLAAHAAWGFETVGRTRKLDLPGLTLTICPRWPGRSRWLRLESAPSRGVLVPA